MVLQMLSVLQRPAGGQKFHQIPSSHAHVERPSTYWKGHSREYEPSNKTLLATTRSYRLIRKFLQEWWKLGRHLAGRYVYQC